ncbi:hypothetical protein [Candidatus Poriferisodalis sp.]|uniref:hypothetical protein n=1 Tax=Candidatus Poriferisodalis sp. TaxID=3101277 RepID=UPI003B011D0E
MSEEDRSRLYAWFREHTDEPLAEYLMSCLAPAPLSDLATKADLRELGVTFNAQIVTEVGALRQELAAQREQDRAETGALREQDRAETGALRERDRAEAAALRERDRAEAAAHRDEDRRERKADLRSVKAHHYTVIGFIVALFVANLTIL